MRPWLVVAVLLIALGVGALAYQGITYTRTENVLDLGPMHVTAERTRHIPLPPILGAGALIGGLLLLWAEQKRLGQSAGR